MVSTEKLRTFTVNRALLGRVRSTKCLRCRWVQLSPIPAAISLSSVTQWYLMKGVVFCV